MAREFEALRSSCRATQFRLAIDMGYIATGISTICRELQAMDDEEDDISGFYSTLDLLIPTMKNILGDAATSIDNIDVAEVHDLKGDVHDVLEVLV